MMIVVSHTPIRPTSTLRRTSFLLAAAALPAAPALAAGAAPAIDAGSGLLQMIFGLLLVILLLVGSLYLLKRLTAPSGAASLLRVISAAAVGTRERVVIVEVGETWLVLGVAPGQVSKLHELPRQALPASQTPATPQQALQSFAARLKQIMDDRKHHAI
jgi:flagellar protein FliO/FliZ